MESKQAPKHLNSRKLIDLCEELQDVVVYVTKEWDRLYPALPNPIVVQTYRSPELQAAYYSQGREDLESVNKRRKACELAPITFKENVIITKAQPGKSKHQIYPSQAFDIAFIGGRGELDWSEGLFTTYAKIAGTKFPKLKWGGMFKFKDLPHFEI